MVDIKDRLPYGEDLGTSSFTGTPEVTFKDALSIDIPSQGIDVELVPWQNSIELCTKMYHSDGTSERSMFASVYVDEDLNVCVMNYDGSQNVIIFPSNPTSEDLQSPVKHIGKLEEPFHPSFFGDVGGFVSRQCHCSVTVTGFGKMEGNRFVRVNIKHVSGRNGTFFRMGGSIHSRTGTYVPSSGISAPESPVISEDFKMRRFANTGEEYEVPAEKNRIPCVYQILRPSDGQLLANIRAVSGGDEIYVAFVNVYGEPRLDWQPFGFGEDIVIDPKSVPEKKSGVSAAQESTRKSIKRSLSDTFRGVFGFLPWGKSGAESTGFGNRGKIVLSLGNATSGGKRFAIKNKGQVPFNCAISTH